MTRAGTSRRNPANLPGGNLLQSWHGWWSGYAFNGQFYTSGTGPVITWSGTVPGQCGLVIKITFGGTLGTAKIQFSTNNGTTYNGSDITSAASVNLGNGITLAMAAGTYVLNDIYKMVIGTWSGLTAHQFAQATLAKMPAPFVTSRGTPLLTDGVDDIMFCSDSLAGTLMSGQDTPVTVMAVVQLITRGGTGNDDAIWSLNSSTTNALFDATHIGSTGTWGSNKHADSSEAFKSVDTTAASDTNLHIHTLIQHGTTLDYYLELTPLITGASQNSDVATFGNISIGGTGFHGSENNWCNALFYELLTFSGALTAAQLSYQVQRLRNVYGI